MDRKTKVNVGTLLKELRRFESEYPDYDIACCMPDDTRCRMVGMYTDDDGGLNLLMEEEMDGGEYYDVDSILSCLDSYDRTMDVHVAACGLLMDIEVFRDGTFFDVDEDCDAVFCDGEVFGEYEEEESGSGWLTEAEKRMLAEKAKKQKREDCIEYAVLFLMIVLVADGFLYNVWAAVTRSGAALWENILWSVTCLFLLVIGVLTLHYNKPWKKEE